MTDYVSIRDLHVPAVIGVHDWEREIEQTLIVSVEMAADVRQAAASDDLADALDYSAVAETIAAVLREGKFRLIETAAERVADRLLGGLPVALAPPRAPQANHQRPRPSRHLRRRGPRPGATHRLHRRHHHRTHSRNSMITKGLVLSAVPKPSRSCERAPSSTAASGGTVQGELHARRPSSRGEPG